MALGHGLLRQMERLWTGVNSWVWEDHMDAEELIDEYLAEHVDMVNHKGDDWSWQSYTDPFTKKVWYIQEDMDWDWLGGHDDPSMDTKLPWELVEIP